MVHKPFGDHFLSSQMRGIQEVLVIVGFVFYDQRLSHGIPSHFRWRFLSFSVYLASLSLPAFVGGERLWPLPLLALTPPSCAPTSDLLFPDASPKVLLLLIRPGQHLGRDARPR